MPVTGGTLRVEGLSELQRAFKIVGDDLPGDLRDGLRKAAEPVEQTAERLTRVSLNRGQVPWWQMRIGVTRASVYMAPQQRGRKGRDQRYRRRSYRTKVLPLMISALNANQASVRAATQRVLNRSIDKWGRLG